MLSFALRSGRSRSLDLERSDARLDARASVAEGIAHLVLPMRSKPDLLWRQMRIFVIKRVVVREARSAAS